MGRKNAIKALIVFVISLVSVQGIYAYTDDTTGETLIISTDKKVYTGLTQVRVYVNITNIGNEKRFVDLSTYHTDLSGVDVKELYVLEDVPITVPDYKLVTKEVPSDTNSGYTNYTYYEQVGSHVEYVEELSRLTDNDTFINAMKAKQGIPAKYADRESRQEKKAPGIDNTGKKLAKKARLYGLSIESGETKKFMMLITFPMNSSGEFFIETYDINTGESRGLLDPWWDSNWHYKIPLQVTNDNPGGVTNGTVLYSADIAEELSNLSTSNETFDLNSIRIVEVNANGTIIKEVSVDTELANLSGWWKFDEGDGTVAYDTSSKGNDGTHYGNTKLLMHFDEGSGTTAVDESLYGNNGTISNANWTTGKSGSALEFDGAGDYVDIDDATPSLTLGNNGFTVSFWLKFPFNDSSDSNYVFMKGSYVGVDWPKNLGFQTRHYGNRTGATFPYGSSMRRFYYSWDNYIENEWSYITMVVDRDIGRFAYYLNGDLVWNETNSSYKTVDSDGVDGNFRIGKTHTGNDGFRGTIDEVAIYSRALTATEVRALYNNSAPATVTAKWIAEGSTGAGETRYYDLYFDTMENGAKDDVYVNYSDLAQDLTAVKKTGEQTQEGGFDHNYEKRFKVPANVSRLVASVIWSGLYDTSDLGIALKDPGNTQIREFSSGAATRVKETETVIPLPGLNHNITRYEGLRKITVLNPAEGYWGLLVKNVNVTQFETDVEFS